MAKLRWNVALRGVRGAIGGLVFREMPDGSMTVSSKPDFSRRRFSQGQREQQGRVKQAAAYAREAAKVKPIYAELARGTGKSAYNFAFADWFHAPVIHGIERMGGVIRVNASDDVMVTRVEVSIVDEAGEVQVRGEAKQVEGDVWEFVSDLPGRLVVRVWDLARNVTEGGGGNWVIG